LGLFNITKAAITPGTQPVKVRIKVIRNDPHPLSITAIGGKMMARKTLNRFIVIYRFY
jgi:hypothetical protein